MFNKTEEEQIQLIKEWFHKYYLWIVAIILVTGLGAFGWNYQLQSTQETQIRASALYNDIQGFALAITNESDAAKQDSSLELMRTSTETISSLYPENIYTMLAQQVYASTLARLGQFDQAIELLQPLKSSDDPLVKNNSIIALAKLYWQQNKADEALQLLKQINKEAGLYAVAKEIEGDILLSEKDLEAAAKAYQESIDNQTTTNNLLKLKINYVSK